MSQHTIYITGSAKNLKGQAVLEAENIGLYCILGIASWKEEWVNRRIKVIGDLVTGKPNQLQVISKAVVQLVEPAVPGMENETAPDLVKIKPIL